MGQLMLFLRMAPWLAILGLLLALGVVDRRADKWEAHAGKLSAELQRISTAKNEQSRETQRNIDKGRERIVYVDRVAGEIEKAPLPGNCATPPQVLQADL